MARMGYKRPINSVKHIIDSSGQLAVGLESVTDVVNTVNARSVITVPNEVENGATVGSIFVSIYVLGSSGSTSGLIDWYIWKKPGDAIQAGTVPTPGNTGVSQLRRFIFHEEKGLSATQDGTPMVFKGVIRIPPRFRRMGQQDKIQIVILSSEEIMDFCVKAIYKSFK